MNTCKRGHTLKGENAAIQSDGRARCKTCRRDAKRRWDERNPDYYSKYVSDPDNRAKRRRTSRIYHLMTTYGLTRDEAEEAVCEREVAVCAICSRSGDLHYDHDHETGLYRGWLCGECNRGIGLFHDDPSLLTLAAKYLSPL